MIRENEMLGGERDLAEMPVALQMDLLVDGELAEGQRAVLLRRLEMGGGEQVSAEWRELALRFLQGQVEKETVQQLMAGGALVPVDFSAVDVGGWRFPVVRWMGSTAVRATAAGLLIAAVSAVITLYVVRRPSGRAVGGDFARGAQYFTGSVPGEAVGYSSNIPVTVPVLQTGHDAAMNLFPGGGGVGNGATDGRDKMQWRSVVIQKDENGNAVVIPVNAMNVKVY